MMLWSCRGADVRIIEYWEKLLYYSFTSQMAPILSSLLYRAQ